MNAPRGEARPRLVALKYARAEDVAPRVTAKGVGETARALLALAEAHGVPVRRDGDLVELLSACEVGHEVPFELYHAVALLLAELARARSALGGASAA